MFAPNPDFTETVKIYQKYLDNFSFLDALWSEKVAECEKMRLFLNQLPFRRVISAGELLRIGILYQQGTEIKKNDKQAQTFFEAAAQKGAIEAYWYLGHLCEHSSENWADFIKTLYYYHKALAAGYATQADLDRVLANKPFNFSTLLMHLNEIPVEERYPLLLLLKDKIENGSEVAALLKALPIHRLLEFATLMQNKIRLAEQVAEVVAVLPEADRLNFVLSLKQLIQSPIDFSKILRFIEPLDSANLHAFAYI